MSKNAESFVAVSIITEGDTPFNGSILAAGFAVVGEPKERTSMIVRPLFAPGARKPKDPPELDQLRLKAQNEGITGPAFCKRVAALATHVKEKYGCPVLACHPSGEVMTWLRYYFYAYGEKDPFSPTSSVIDLRSYWWGMEGGPFYATGLNSTKGIIWPEGEPAETWDVEERAVRLAEIMSRSRARREKKGF
jgi:hypothetical protein